MTFSQERIDKVFTAVRKKYAQHIATYEAQTAALDGQITTLEAKARELTRSFATIAPSAQKYVNEELEDVDTQIKRLALERTNMEHKKPMDLDKVLKRIRKFSENIGQAIAQQGSELKKAQLFGLLFKTLPTYTDLHFRNQKAPLFTGVHPVFSLLANDNFPMVIPAGIEPALPDWESGVLTVRRWDLCDLEL